MGAKAAMKDDVFVTADGIGGHLEYAGRLLKTPVGWRGYRFEVREKMGGFELHNVAYSRYATDTDTWWVEQSRHVVETHQSLDLALKALGQHEEFYLEAVAEDRKVDKYTALIERGSEHTNSKAYRQELADEFRKAIEALPPMPEKTCDWCGIDIPPTALYYPMVHDEFMCRKCYEEYSR